MTTQNTIMTSLLNIWFLKLHILKKLIEGISLPNFIGLGCLVQILRGLVEPQPDLHALRKPSPYRVKKFDYSQVAISPINVKLENDIFKRMLGWDFLFLFSRKSFDTNEILDESGNFERFQWQK